MSKKTKKPVKGKKGKVTKKAKAKGLFANVKVEKVQPPVDNDHAAPGCEKFDDNTIALVKRPNNAFPVWPDAKCGSCGHDASEDPNGECFLYTLTCPSCGKIGCDECFPSGRGIKCPECEDSGG